MPFTPARFALHGFHLSHLILRVNTHTHTQAQADINTGKRGGHKKDPTQTKENTSMNGSMTLETGFEI